MNLRPRIKYCRIKKAIVQDLCRSLVRDERIVTTLAKAKWMEKFGNHVSYNNFAHGINLCIF